MTEKAKAFLLTLHSPQIDSLAGSEYAQFDFHHPVRESFDYFAPSSQMTYGLPLFYMNPEQQSAALALLKASLSDDGYVKVRQIHKLEAVLARRESAKPVYIRHEGAYYFAIFGTPADVGAWSWRIQGHHLALQWTLLDGRVVSSTPQFMGAQPALLTDDDAMEGFLPGTRVLGPLEDRARELITLLSEEELRRSRAWTLWDIRSTNVHAVTTDGKPNRLDDSGTGLRGVSYGALTAVKQKKLEELVFAHLAVQSSDVREDRLERLKAAGWDTLKFHFMGGLQPGEPLQYWVRGETFLIEYLNNAFTLSHLPADHQHAVWRDYNNDWGQDALRRQPS